MTIWWPVRPRAQAAWSACWSAFLEVRLGCYSDWGTGALIGGAIDVRRAEQIDDAIGQFSQTVPPGSIAVVADVAEPAVEVIDGEMKS